MDVRIVSNIGTSYKSKKTLPIATPESLRKGMLRAEGGGGRSHANRGKCGTPGLLKKCYRNIEILQGSMGNSHQNKGTICSRSAPCPPAITCPVTEKLQISRTNHQTSPLRFHSWCPRCSLKIMCVMNPSL